MLKTIQNNVAPCFAFDNFAYFELFISKHIDFEISAKRVFKFLMFLQFDIVFIINNSSELCNEISYLNGGVTHFP